MTALDDLEWTPIDQDVRDPEFQFLSEFNLRIIAAAFQIPTDDLVGYLSDKA